MRANILISSFIAGGIFGVGLLISQMTNPSKIIAFLDIFGNWDPSLILVMGNALFVTYLGYRWVLKRHKPQFDDIFHLPTLRNIDRQLVLGATLFGIGWGLVGLCPGPALVISPYGGMSIIYFLGGMIVAIIGFHIIAGMRRKG